MSDESMLKIISLCLSLDAKAARIYHDLAECASDGELREFWKSMASEEREHVRFWRELRSSAERGIVPHLFDQPFETFGELSLIQKKLDLLATESKNCSEPLNAFVMAFRTEFCLLHPAVSEFFRLVGLTSEQEDLEDRYDAHLAGFIDGLNKLGATSPEMELLGEVIQKLWHETRRLVQQSHTDSLTDLLNRRGLLNAMVPLSALAQRNGHNVGILMLDLDHFKQVNDSYGHLIGDEILKRVGGILRDSIRKMDLAGRFGGEEFLIFLPNVQPEYLFHVADKIRRKVESEVSKEMEIDLVRPITVSIGGAQGTLSLVPQEAIDALVRAADEALYKAKEAGRNRIVLCDA